MIPTPSDVRNEDWTKTRTWDIWLGYKLVSTLDELKEYCDRQQTTLDHFLSLPAAEAMPDGLKEKAALYRQDQMAGRIVGEEEKSQILVRGVVERMEEVMEKGLLRRVRSRRGVEKYDQPIGSVIKPDVVPSKPSIRPDAPTSTAKPSARSPQKGGHYGTFSLDDYLDGLSDDEFPSWTTAYKAAWLNSDGELDAVADHDAIPGGREGAFVDGKVRVAIAGYKGGRGNVHYQIRGKANKRQASMMVRLMEELDSRSTKVNVTGNDQGEDEPVNGEFSFSTPAELRAFLRDPTKRPGEGAGGGAAGGAAARERAAFLAQFKEDEEGVEEKGIRKVRTPEGARRYNQPIGSIIRPGPRLPSAPDLPGFSRDAEPPAARNPKRDRWAPDNARQAAALSRLRARPSLGRLEVDGEMVEDAIEGKARFSGIRDRIDPVLLDELPRRRETLPTDSIIATKHSLKRDSIAAVVHAVDDPTGPWARPGYLPVVVRVGDQNYLWDGHHRLEGALMLDEPDMDVEVIDLDPDTLRPADQLSDPELAVLATVRSTQPEIEQKVEKIFRDRAEVEPVLTEALQEDVRGLGGEMMGLDLRMKKPGGVLKKIDRYVAKKNRSPEAAADEIADSLRYTAAFPTENFVDNVNAAMRSLTARGYRFIEVENHFPQGDAYNGINTVAVDERTGLKFELQFHTPESFHVKQVLNHADYEWFREEPPLGTYEERRVVWERMRDNTDSITFPLGIETLGDPVVHPFRG